MKHSGAAPKAEKNRSRARALKKKPPKAPLLKALLAEGIHSKAAAALEELGLETAALSYAPSAEELMEKLQGVSVLGSRSRALITKEVLSKSDLLAIGAFCIGVNQIDLAAACRRGTPVFNAPYSNTRSVAEMVMGLIIALSRNLFDVSQAAHSGFWKKTAKNSFEARGKTLGIIGYGHIGSQASVLGEALGMRVIYHDIASKLPIGNAKPSPGLLPLLREADFVSLHVPETPETKGMIGEKEIMSMKKGAKLINTSRGSAVDLPALKKALSSEHLSGAALDVFPEEPKTNSEPFLCPLRGMPQVILTPHIGGSTEEAQEAIALEVSESLKGYIFSGATEGAVNFPPLQLPPIPAENKRISNIHKNRPGVLSQINRLVSESGANIKNQCLATNESIGYLVMDVEKEDIQELAQNISQLEVSIKTRILPPSPSL